MSATAIFIIDTTEVVPANAPKTWQDIEALVAGASVDWGDIGGTIGDQTDLLATFYTQTELDALFGFKSNVGHDHDDRYYTETEIDALLAAVSHGILAVLRSVSVHELTQQRLYGFGGRGLREDGRKSGRKSPLVREISSC